MRHGEAPAADMPCCAGMDPARDGPAARMPLDQTVRWTGEWSFSMNGTQPRPSNSPVASAIVTPAGRRGAAMPLRQAGFGLHPYGEAAHASSAAGIRH